MNWGRKAERAGRADGGEFKRQSTKLPVGKKLQHEISVAAAGAVALAAWS